MRNEVMGAIRGLDRVQILSWLASVSSIIAMMAKSGNTVLFGVVAVAGVTAILWRQTTSRREPEVVGRPAMIQTAQRLIADVKHEAILFGGDMSWAGEYRTAVYTATSRGKRVTAVFPENDSPRVRDNASILKGVGATLLPLPKDLGLRAILIDPDDSRDAMVYIASRNLRTGSVPVRAGERGTPENYHYLAKVYTLGADWPIVDAVRRLATHLLSR
jgi:hypothetical protein